MDSSSLVPVINELQEIFQAFGLGLQLQDTLQLPQIVAIGSQGTGKSSVLESLVGKSFLPRGTGIVTRCPLLVQMIPSTKEEYAELVSDEDDEPSKRFDDFTELQNAIKAKTSKLAGSTNGISSKQITIRVFSPSVVELSIVDLPGIVKVPTGEQPQDIEQKVTDMILNYIRNPNAIILAVCAGNSYLTTSDSLKMAKEVDPNGNRTLAVLTKLDLLDKGTNALKELQGQVISVKHGIVGVINRSQEDLQNNKSVEEALKDEMDKLEKYYPLLSGQIGSTYLSKRLKELLLEHIKDSVPELKIRVGNLTQHEMQQLAALGQKLPTETSEKIRLMSDIIQSFETSYRLYVEEKNAGATTNSCGLYEKNIPTIGSRINKARVDYCSKMRGVDPFKNLDDKVILDMLKNNTNWEGFASIEDVFKQIVNKQIMLLENPCTIHAEEVHKILHLALHPCLKDRRVSKLNSEILSVMRNLLDESLIQMKARIETMFKIQTMIVFTADKEFARLLAGGGQDSAADASGGGDGSTPTDASGTANEQHSIALKRIKLLIGRYFESVRETIMNIFPKDALYYLYHETMNEFHHSIGKTTYPNVENIMVEPENILEARQHSEKLLRACKKASEALNRIQDTQIEQ